MNKPYYPPFSTLSDLQKDKYTSDLKELELYFRICLNLPVYLMYGTLLGTMRNNDYIAHDVDVDLGYLSSYTKEEDVYLERLTLIDKLESDKMLRCRDTQGIKIKFNDNDFDVWTSWITENNEYRVLPFNSLGSKEIALPFKNTTLRGINFSIPQKSEELLNKIYINWKVPVTENYLKNNRRFKLPS
jgi:hypothetical protein